MDSTPEVLPPARGQAEEYIHRELPSLGDTEIADVVRIVEVLVRTFQPERIYAFGSQARGTPTQHSDLDLLVVVPDAGEFPHRLAQEAYRVIGRHALPLDILFMGEEEFDWRSSAVSSLPATVLREGRLLYDRTA